LFGGCDRVPLGLVRGFMAVILQWFELLYTHTKQKKIRECEPARLDVFGKNFRHHPPLMPTIRILRGYDWNVR
jgi:hypothetical protein